MGLFCSFSLNMSGDSPDLNHKMQPSQERYFHHSSKPDIIGQYYFHLYSIQMTKIDT